MSHDTLLRYSFEYFGPTPSTTSAGREAAAQVQHQISDRSVLLLDFSPMLGVDVAFFDTFLGGLRNVIRRRQQLDYPIKVAATGMTEDVQYGFRLLLANAGIAAMAYEDGGMCDLITASPRLQETFAVAGSLTKEHGDFSIDALATALGMKIPATHQRVMDLTEMAALTRYRDTTVKRCKKHLYQAVTGADVAAK